MTYTTPFTPSPRTRSTPPACSSHLALTLLGPSSAMAHLWTQIRRLAPHLRTVLLTGEPECGQDAVAQLLFDLSTRNHRSFLPLTADEAHLRLLRPGGFTSLPTDIFLYLPEVHQFSLAAQDALLDFIRNRRGRSLTVVATSPEDLNALVGLGRFSGELAEILGAVRIALPSLRERSEDLPMLISQLISAEMASSDHRAPQVGEDFLRAAMDHPWTGNFGELTDSIAFLCSGPHDGLLSLDHLNAALQQSRQRFTVPVAPTRMVPLSTVMNEHIASVLQACRGNKLRAAETLGISRSTLYRMLESAAAAQSGALPLAS